MQGVAENAVTLKTLASRAAPRRILGILEQASLEPDAAVRRQLLTFVVAAGVETISGL